MKAKYFWFIAFVTGTLFLTGCAGNQGYSGNAETYLLSDRHIIYQDLTRPLGPNNIAVKGTRQSLRTHAP